MKYLQTETISQDQKTIHWFDVDGEDFGVVKSDEPDCIIDNEGYPVNTDDMNHVCLRELFDLSNTIR